MNTTLFPLLLLALAVLLFLAARALRRQSGLPAGEVTYADAGGWTRPEKPLFSARLQLTGKPDYLVREAGALIPVEIKSGRAPAGGAHAGHLAQLAAYCALVEETYGSRPAYGLIQYADRTLRVDYTPELEAALHSRLADMRADFSLSDVARSHASPARCRACGLRLECGQNLA